MATKPYELTKALLEGDKIQGLQAPSENAFHQIAAIDDYFLVDSAVPNSQIKPNFDFILDSLFLFAATDPTPTDSVKLEIFSSSNTILYTQTLPFPESSRHFNGFPAVPFEKGSRIAINFVAVVPMTLNAKLFLKRVFIHAI